MTAPNKFKWLLTPLLAYICFIGIYIGISYFNHNNYLFMPIWDVKHYLDISEIGYQVHPCTPGVDGNLGDICGNPGWFPMWPLMVKLFRPILGGSSQVTFIGLTFLFTLAGFLLLFRFIEKSYGYKAALFTLIALIFSPAGFYMLTGFPYALFLLLFMLYLFLLYSSPGWGRSVGLFIIAMMLSLTYPTGILIAVVPLVWLIFDKENKFSAKSFKEWSKAALYIFPFLLGMLLLWLYFYVKFDDFFLQLHFQAKYHRTWAFPIYIMFKSFFNQSLLSPENIVILWYGLIFFIFYPYKLRRELWILALVLYLFSLTTGTTMSIYRHYLIIFPAYMLIGVSTRPLWLKSAYCLIGLILSLFILFPLFMNYRLI
jgi:hypothetical protein